ncbi:LLM class flavin-dependent oxidoreductase [Agrobacterium rosae]|uniref:LLM class flavin-dependent oxidoreductase n=1 Tax=Agrobacterium rosae TaxID=1972867 RepID=A0AAW9FQU2_9HYPH|nr:LLM class flavin-dependent oxidoreductase [Agrobacterium rosae]MDX8305531.1 LLM class flavin-dependent oxidoreductase [Agrobacterium rosae]
MIPIYTTCPPSSAFQGKDYLAHVGEVARWSEQQGATGMLIYTDNSLVDPWCVAQAALTETDRLLPLIAVQPIYAPPFSVAKRIASLAHLYGRAIALNMVAGGFVKDLATLGDKTAHDDRYERLLEYTQLIKALLLNETVTFEGRYFTLSDTRLLPQMPSELLPKIFVSGSSSAGANVAASLEAIAVNYPPAPDAITAAAAPGSFARVGIIAADTDAEAWARAHHRFPPSRRGEMTHRMATAVSDSVWHKTLSAIAENQPTPVGAYWLHPLKTYRTFCPYLVGSHQTVGATLAQYRAAGFDGFILDVPQTEDDLVHAMEAFRLSDRRSAIADSQNAPLNVGPADV